MGQAPTYKSTTESSGRQASPLTRLSLATKLLLLVLLPLAVILGVTVALVINALGRLESDTSIARLRDEVAVISQQFAKAESDLARRAGSLAGDPNIIEATRMAGPGVDRLLLSSVIRSKLDYLEVVDENGQAIGEDQPGRGLLTREGAKELRSLGLSNEKATRLFSTGRGWLLTAVQPVKMGGNVVGALSAGRLLDGRALSDLTSIGRTCYWCFLMPRGEPTPSPEATSGAS